MKIYTKTGDGGETSLFDGTRVSKDDIRIESYGSVDELNAHLGLLIQWIKDDALVGSLKNIQSTLFVIGSHLATQSEEAKRRLPEFNADQSLLLESKMDLMDQNLEALKHFILPGGGLASAQAHICRTVCRRAERRIISLSSVEPIDPEIIVYLNRLSDYFFILSRFLCKMDGQQEHYWNPNG